MHGIEEILVAVVADAGLLVRRDVGRVERAERQFEGEPAGEWLAALRGVANDTVGSVREVLAAFDQARLRKLRGHAGRVGVLVVGELDRTAAGKIEWPRPA